MSSTFRKLDAMPYTAYIESCCHSLAGAGQYPTDVYLVSLVHLQHFVRKIENTLPSNEFEPSWSPTTPISMYVKSLEEDLQRYKGSLLQHLQLSGELPLAKLKSVILISYTTAPLLMHYHSVEIRLYEIGLSEPPHNTNNPSFRRLDILYACLLSTKSFLEAYFMIPSTSYRNLSFVTWVLLSNTLAILCRLLLVDVEGWDLAHARELVDLPGILQRLIEKFTEAKEIADTTRTIEEEKDIFYQYAQMMLWVKSNYESRLSIKSMESQQSGDLTADEAMMGDFLNIDDAFWQDFVGGWGDPTP
jgi:hypothetical protein